MRALIVFVLFLTACSNQPAATSPTPTPTPTPSPTAVATTPAPSTPTTTPSPSPITLPSIAQLSAPSGTVVWALVAGTRLFRSSDRGDTWTERSLPGVANIEVSFASDTNGLLLSTGTAAAQCQTQTVTVWRTTDGAGTWQQTQLAPAGIADAMCKRFLSSADSTHAFLTTYSPNAGSLIYRTADGGASWTASAALPIPPNLASQGASFVSITERPRGFGSIVLVAGGAGQTKDVFRSTDGGATFAYASTAPIFDASVAYVTAARWVQIGPPGGSQQTLDGGAVWQAYTTDYSQAAPIAPDVVFGDASVGYATVRGAIQRTIDGGAHWTTLKTPGT
jgi:photosystem II stability/assembly factor-like uncharacterized protein